MHVQRVLNFKGVQLLMQQYPKRCDDAFGISPIRYIISLATHYFTATSIKI